MQLRNIAIIFLILVAGNVYASQREERLDQLFVQLKTSSTVWETKIIENKIQAIWMISDQEDINLLMRKGIVALQMQELPVALEVFDLIVTKDPEFAEGWNKRAMIYYLMENYEASVKDIQKAIALEPRHFNAFSGLAFIYAKLGKYDDALDAFQQLSKIHPRYEGLEDYLSRLKKAVNATRI